MSNLGAYLTEAQVIVKVTEAVKNHPNSRNAALGPLKHWTGILYRNDEAFRTTVKDKNGNALADYASALVEKKSLDSGRPWKRSESIQNKKNDKATIKKDKNGNIVGKSNANAPMDDNIDEFELLQWLDDTMIARNEVVLQPIEKSLPAAIENEP